MGVMVLICLVLFISCGLCEMTDNVVLLGQGRVNEGAVLIRDSRGEEFQFLRAEGWTSMNAQVACRHFGYRHAAFAKTIEGQKHLSSANFSYNCNGNEQTLDQCSKTYPSQKVDDEKTEDTVGLAGVLCYDEVRSISQFPFLELAVQPPLRLQVSLDPGDLEWRILCTESDSSLRNIACQQTGYLVADEILFPYIRADLLLAHKSELCTELELQACNTSFLLVNNASCSEYRLEPFTCLHEGYRLLGHLANVCQKDLCQYGDHNSSNPDRRSCSCDSNCEFYKDCCFDYVTECLYGFTSLTVLHMFGYKWPVRCASSKADKKLPGEISIDQFRCLSYDESNHTFWLVAKCASNWLDRDNIKENCETEWKESSAPNLWNPIADMENNFHYKNIFCAWCNGFFYNGFPVPYQTWVTPPPDEDPRWEFEPDDCTECHYDFIPRSSFNPRPCINTISSCPAGYPDEGLVRACSDYLSPVRYDGVLYRNEHCAKCNGHGYPVLEDRCPCEMKRCQYQIGNSPSIKRFPHLPPPLEPMFVFRQHLHDIKPLCSPGFHFERDFSGCVPDYETSLHEHPLNCTSIRDILLIEWSAEFLWSYNPPTSCLFEGWRFGFPDVGLINDTDAPFKDWFFTYFTEYPFLRKVRAQSTRDTRNITVDKLKQTLALVFPQWMDRCKVVSTSIEQICHVGMNVSSNECPGELVEDAGNASFIVLNNETYVIHNESLYLLHFIRDSFRNSLSDLGKQSWSHVKVFCLEWTSTYFEASCRTMSIPKGSYQLVYINGKILARYKGLTLQPTSFTLTTDGNLKMCEISTLFMFTEAQIITKRILCTASLVALLLTFITYCFFPSLRNIPGLCIMTLVMILIAITLLEEYVNPFVMHIPWLCKTVAILSHYLRLAAFCWMSILAWNLARTFALPSSLQRVQRSRRQFLRVAFVGFGLPALVVLPCVIIDLCECTSLPLWYGPGPSSCWINDAWSNLVVLYVPVLISLALNVVLFTMTAIGIRRSRQDAEMATSQRTKTSLKQKFSALLTYIKVSSVMGFTSIAGFVAYFSGVNVLWYVYITLNSLQGLFIFMFFGCSTQSRNLWRKKFARKSHRQVEKRRQLTSIDKTSKITTGR